MDFGTSRRAVIRQRRRPQALPVDDGVTCASTLDVLKLDASADFAGGGNPPKPWRLSTDLPAPAVAGFAKEGALRRQGA